MEETKTSEGTSSTPKSPLPPSICALQKKQNSNSNDRSSPEPNCAICLSKLENKSFTDSCLHQFCFNCLLEWSKVKAQCPLCKQSFKSIIHNVRSEEDYDQYHIPTQGELPIHWEWRPRFRYQTTMTTSYQIDRHRDRNQIHEIIHFLNLQESYIPPSSRNLSRIPNGRRRQLATADFRRSVYRNDLWTRPLPDMTGRHRQCTPDFFRMNPAQMHRLVPWLNRELSVLLQIETHMAVVLDIILNLCVRYPIRSDDMRIALVPFLGQNTIHFLHEFYTFASSPYDLIGYDCESQYAPRTEYESHVIETPPTNVDSDTSDIIVLSEPIRSPIPRPSPAEHVISSDSEVEFVGYVKPRNERTPVIINLSDDDQSPVAGPSTQDISDSDVFRFPWNSEDSRLVSLDPRDEDNSLLLELGSFLSPSSNSYDRDPEYVPSTSSTRVNKKKNISKKLKISKIKNRPVNDEDDNSTDAEQEYSPKNTRKNYKRKHKRPRLTSSSSSESSDEKQTSSSSSDEYVPSKIYKNKYMKYDGVSKSYKTNRNNRNSNNIDSDSSSKRVKKQKSKKNHRRTTFAFSETERRKRKKHSRKRTNSPTSWRIKTPKSESDQDKEKVGARPRLRSIVISKAALNNNNINNNNNPSSTSSLSSSSATSLQRNYYNELAKSNRASSCSSSDSF